MNEEPTRRLVRPDGELEWSQARWVEKPAPEDVPVHYEEVT